MKNVTMPQWDDRIIPILGQTICVGEKPSSTVGPYSHTAQPSRMA